MRKYGLALGGGGTKGAYHLGVIDALDKMNIEICAVCGTSIGSINAAFFAQGDYELCRELWNDISPSNIVEASKLGYVGDNLLDSRNLKNIFSTIFKNNGIDAEPLRNMLSRSVDEDKIRKSEIDFGLVTYSLDDLEETELFIEDIPQGLLVDYLMASAAVPGLKKTVINDKKFIDGGVVNNVPGSMLIRKGITDIITVNVGGIGIVKGIESIGINHIDIKCSENIIGHFDFNEKNISDMIKMGYYDTLRAFSRIVGNIYSFNISDYHNARLKYSSNIVNGIEKAAQIFEIDKFKLYKFDSLKNAVIETAIEKLKSSSDNPSSFDGLKIQEEQLLIKFIKHIINKEFDSISNKIFQNILKDIYPAANAIIYFIAENQ